MYLFSHHFLNENDEKKRCHFDCFRLNSGRRRQRQRKKMNFRKAEHGMHTHTQLANFFRMKSKSVRYISGQRKYSFFFSIFHCFVCFFLPFFFTYSPLRSCRTVAIGFDFFSHLSLVRLSCAILPLISNINFFVVFFIFCIKNIPKCAPLAHRHHLHNILQPTL